jgi:diguanylate cyclase (GGDEF)-like protein
LTGLANFRALSMRLEGELKRAIRYHFPVAILMIDMDGMKEINDRYGHDAGNQAISAFAKHLLACLRETDFAARFGGDEFVVILPYDSCPNAVRVAERIRSGIPQLSLPDDGSSSSDRREVTISTGVACCGQGMTRCNPEELLRAADSALYQAKRQGRNCVVTYGDSGSLI